jgi:nitroreductase
MALPQKAADFLSAMERRYACKLFDGRPLPAELERYVLECGRLSPSSFGLEHWKFIANRPEGTVRADDGLIRAQKGSLREALYRACFSQEAVQSAGLVVVIFVRRAEAYDPDGAFVRQRSERFPGGHPIFRADFSGYYDFLKSGDKLEDWARAQAYIPLANMMTGAAAAGIDSCAIEGYKEEDVLSACGADPQLWRAGIVAVFGYPAENRREKIRESFKEIVEYRA